MRFIVALLQVLFKNHRSPVNILRVLDVVHGAVSLMAAALFLIIPAQFSTLMLELAKHTHAAEA